MFKLILGLGAIYGLAWICSTPESRAAARAPVNRFGKRFAAVVFGGLAAIWILSLMAGPLPAPGDRSSWPPGRHLAP